MGFIFFILLFLIGFYFNHKGDTTNSNIAIIGACICYLLGEVISKLKEVKSELNK